MPKPPPWRFPPHRSLFGYGWGGDHDDRKSTSACVFRLGHGVLSWKSKKQTSVALSSVESEYMAMCQATKEAAWLSGLLEELGIELRTPLIIYDDNQGVLTFVPTLARDPSTSTYNIVPHGTNYCQVSTYDSHDRPSRWLLIDSHCVCQCVKLRLGERLRALQRS